MIHKRIAVVAVVAALLCVVVALVAFRDGDETSVVASEGPTTTEVAGSTTVSTTVSPTTRIEPAVSTIPAPAPCPTGSQIRVPCPIDDGDHLPVQTTGLRPLTAVQFGLCVEGPAESTDQCTPGVTHQTNTDDAGRLSTFLTFERVLLIGDRLVDCAVVRCELRIYAKGDPPTTIIETRRQPLVYTTNRARAVAIDGDDALEHRVPRKIEILGSLGGDSNAQPMITQCVRQPRLSWQSYVYEGCVGVAVSDVRRERDRLTALITPSRWGNEWDPSNPTVQRPVDCGAATQPCYLKIRILGEPGVIRRPVRIVGVGTPARIAASQTVALEDQQVVTLTLFDMPPRRWGTVALCLDPERNAQVPPPDGDGYAACVLLVRFATSDVTTWPGAVERTDVQVPRFVPWHGVDHDCADARGCRLIVHTGSWEILDFGLTLSVQFAA